MKRSQLGTQAPSFETDPSERKKFPRRSAHRGVDRLTLVRATAMDVAQCCASGNISVQAVSVQPRWCLRSCASGLASIEGTRETAPSSPMWAMAARIQDHNTWFRAAARYITENCTVELNAPILTDNKDFPSLRGSHRLARWAVRVQ